MLQCFISFAYNWKKKQLFKNNVTVENGKRAKYLVMTACIFSNRNLINNKTKKTLKRNHYNNVEIPGHNVLALE